MIEVTNALGETRVATDVREGTFNCPFCGGYCEVGDPCGNPMCSAGKYATRENVLADMHEAAIREDEQRERQKHSRIQAEMTARWRQEREERDARELAEIREAGQCVTCYRQRYGKRVRHRKPDFHAATA